MKASSITLSIAGLVALGAVAVSQLQKGELSREPPHAARTKADSELRKILNLPEGNPETFSLAVPFREREFILEFQKNRVFGKNTRFLVDDGSGSLKQIEQGEDGGYTGQVQGNLAFTVTAVLTKEGLRAAITRPGEKLIRVEPIAGEGKMHRIFEDDIENQKLGESFREQLYRPQGSEETSLYTRIDEQVEASSGMITTGLWPMAPISQIKMKSTATLPPKRVMDVLEYEIGVEIGSRAFLADTYGGDLKKAQASAQSIVSNLDSRYLRAAGIKHRLGTVIIRTQAETDPLRDKVTATGAGGKAGSSLAAFRDYWNKNADKVGKTHDLAVYHVKHAPSGLAYVNSVGSSNRYATSGGNGATSWANGTLAHEFGHSWNLRHTNDSGFFYEAKPRNPKGSNKAGGPDYYVSIMHGGGNHNIGRLATEEANMVYKIREQKRKFGDVVTEPGPIPPFGHRDIAATVDGKALTLDVIENDYDANNDVLDVQLLDTVSNLGGKVALSQGTGPGGRNEIIYTPPKGSNGRDFFHYTVFDTSGGTDWGAVYVTNSGPLEVDLAAEVYNYDFGPASSPSKEDWTVISEQTKGDIFWELRKGASLTSVDRRAGGGVNEINRDFVAGSVPAILRHKITNGLWSITMNVGDRSENLDNLTVRAEGRDLVSRLDAPRGKFPYANGEVAVTDGELTIEFSDQDRSGAKWAVTRLSLERIGDAPLEKKSLGKLLRYDAGPADSPLAEDWQLLSHEGGGAILWSGDEVNSLDRNPAEEVGLVNRDFIYGKGVSTLSHKVSNGAWLVRVTLGDTMLPHDLMGVKAEGKLISDSVSTAAGEFLYVTEEGGSAEPAHFEVEVSDGELNLEFFVSGGDDPNWVLTSVSLRER